MSLNITALTPVFCAEVSGVDLRLPLEDAIFDEIREVLDAYSILIIPGEPLDDDQQVAFSERFGPLERTLGANPASGTAFARQSNLDMKSGDIIPTDDKRMHYQQANMLWHADSSYKPMPSLCSVLSAREVPPDGGATEFASTRAAYESLSDAAKSKIDDAVVEHDIVYSRGLVGFEFPKEIGDANPPARHPLVQTNPVTGRKSVLIGAHAKRIIGWSDDESRAMLDDLLERAAAPENAYSHAWRNGDVVIWDNRAALHRATPYDHTRHRRLMQRTTIGNPAVIETYGAYPAIAEA
ncbi:MAG: TauD/TfdA family dioxygenase [Rhodospirillaceae bacterium]|jgi:alpha-ketoglutarate-dependent 2,4-dichlorophenoxyacetate dioxygenase|nr:TauD/TfdA family dioxygenase [Rhodospirillaceae bacterium]MBT3909924.1 TauD/TfdA family dioxygenase [Rhodospirillaceae bacterium]MBT5298741.1 TauD/TfdA family dioxygenase [Rhodospirillaceae bacterium]MBT5514504.1 TauD/TfdA family dioxygenase [Rhodospirillaceae bacterium]MBT6607068.1 TauD/TfdA family dioxygenase [Rhodospirillaceae bacterium]